MKSATDFMSFNLLTCYISTTFLLEETISVYTRGCLIYEAVCLTMLSTKYCFEYRGCVPTFIEYVK